MIKRWLMSLAGLAFVSASFVAQAAFVEGTDYQVINPPVSTGQPDKVVVTEVFWYGCPHCFRFEPFAEQLEETLPEGAVFERIPSSLNPRWTEHARAYYSFQMMNVLDQIHRVFFDAIHVERQRLTSMDTIAEFVAKRGLDAEAFKANYFSFPVETQIRKNIQKEKRYGHRGVPAVIVNGKYLVSASLAGSNERMVDIINELVARELNP